MSTRSDFSRLFLFVSVLIKTFVLQWLLFVEYIETQMSEIRKKNFKDKRRLTEYF